jgi:hypothetical protein
MTSASLLFGIGAAAAFAYFVFVRRYFDLFSVAFVGVLFYFSPMFWGSVLQMTPESNPTIPPAAQLIAGLYVIGLVVAGVVGNTQRDDDNTPTESLSIYYIALAGIGFVAATIVSRGEIFSLDKVVVLSRIGYWFAVFEVAASLACVSAVVDWHPRYIFISCLLMALDLLVGFRAFAVLTALSVAVVLLRRHGRLHLVTKLHTYGFAALALVLAMLLVHSARFSLFEQMSALTGATLPVAKSEMRGDTIQYGDGTASSSATATPPPITALRNETAGPALPNAGSAQLPEPAADSLLPSTTAPIEKPLTQPQDTALGRWASILVRLFRNSEPFTIQATLAETIHRNYSCDARNIFKSAYLFLPPGIQKIWPNSFPPTFYDEFKPVLFPSVTYGLGGNIWAEMLCRFGYTGVVIFGVLMMAALYGLQHVIRRCRTDLIAPLTLGGVIIAFYIHRNDLHYTLVLMRQIVIIYIAAFGVNRMILALARK